MYKTKTGARLSKGDVLWAEGFKLIRSVGPRRIVFSTSPFIGHQPVFDEPYENVRGFWFLTYPPGNAQHDTPTFLEETLWLRIPEGRDAEAAAIASALWGPVDEDAICFEGERKYKPRSWYGFSYTLEETVYRALVAYLEEISYKEVLDRARNFCFDPSTWPEALGLYLRGDNILREYIHHHLNENIMQWLAKFPEESRALFDLT